MDSDESTQELGDRVPRFDPIQDPPTATVVMRQAPVIFTATAIIDTLNPAPVVGAGRGTP